MASLSRERQETWGLYQCQAWFAVPLAARGVSRGSSLTPLPAPAEPGPSPCLPVPALRPQHAPLTPPKDGCSAQLKALVKQDAWRGQWGFDGGKNTSKCGEMGLQRQTQEFESLTPGGPWPLLGLCLLLNEVPSLLPFWSLCGVQAAHAAHAL